MFRIDITSALNSIRKEISNQLHHHTETNPLKFQIAIHHNWAYDDQNMQNEIDLLTDTVIKIRKFMLEEQSHKNIIFNLCVYLHKNPNNPEKVQEWNKAGSPILTQLHDQKQLVFIDRLQNNLISEEMKKNALSQFTLSMNKQNNAEENLATLKETAAQSIKNEMMDNIHKVIIELLASLPDYLEKNYSANTTETYSFNHFPGSKNILSTNHQFGYIKLTMEVLVNKANEQLPTTTAAIATTTQTKTNELDFNNLDDHTLDFATSDHTGSEESAPSLPTLTSRYQSSSARSALSTQNPSFFAYPTAQQNRSMLTTTHKYSPQITRSSFIPLPSFQQKLPREAKDTISAVALGLYQGSAPPEFIAETTIHTLHQYKKHRIGQKV